MTLNPALISNSLLYFIQFFCHFFRGPLDKFDHLDFPGHPETYKG